MPNNTVASRTATMALCWDTYESNEQTSASHHLVAVYPCCLKSTLQQDMCYSDIPLAHSEEHHANMHAS
eukprot:7381712-Alexandrium_andersonii.AAC.1